MKKLIDVNLTPVGGWSWKDPTTGFKYSLQYGPGERGLENLMEHVRRYRDQNFHPPINPKELRAAIMHDVCQRDGMQSKCCDASVGGTRTLAQYAKGAAAAAGVVGEKLLGKILPGKHESSMVPEKLANRRGGVCINCPLNVPPDPKNQTLMEKFSDAAMMELIGSRRTTMHDKLQSCAGCTCCMKAKVWFKRKFIHLSAVEREKMSQVTVGLDGQPHTCWQLQPNG